MSSSRAEKIRQPEILSTEGDVNASRRILKVNVAPGDVADVLKNTAARHTHGNKSQLDLITDGAHESRTNNPHQVTKAQIGLGNVQDGAQVNVQSNWDESDPNSDAYIQNKPNLSGVGEENVQSDWNETDIVSDAYIQNKPDTISDSVILQAEDENIRITEDGIIRTTDLTILNFHTAVELQDINSSGSGDIITDTERNNLNINTEHRDKTDNPHQVTKAQVGLSNVPNTDFTSAVNANTAHRNTTTGNPHQVTKSDIGLGNVQDGAEQNVQSDWNETDTGSDAYIQNKPDVITSAERNAINANTTHRETTSGNPHNVTKADVGLGNVPNTNPNTLISDSAYSSSWNGVTNVAPSKNAVYDKIESLGGGGGMDYPGAGIAKSTGTAWSTSLQLDTGNLTHNDDAHLATVKAIKAYGDANWSGSGGSGSISDSAYSSSWNGVTNVAPSKNAVYDKIESLSTDIATSVNEAKGYKNTALIAKDAAYQSSLDANTAVTNFQNMPYFYRGCSSSDNKSTSVQNGGIELTFSNSCNTNITSGLTNSLFTCQTAGLYHFDILVAINGIVSGEITSIELKLDHNGNHFAAKEYAVPAGIVAGQNMTLHLSVSIYLSVNDTINPALSKWGGGTVNVLAEGRSYWSGYKVR